MAKNLSPLDFGLNEAKNGVERYDALLRCHQEAVRQGCGVTYRGIGILQIEIPRGATGIPLTDYTDFAGAVISVRNNVKDLYLFTMIRPTEKIEVGARQVDAGDFSDIDKLKRGDNLLVLKDANPWVAERIGYGYAHYRKDVLLVRGGRAVNKVIMPYNNEWSKVECMYRPVTRKQKVFRNLVFLRDAQSTYKTCLLRVVAEHNVLAKNIKVTTPANAELFGDHVFMVEDCTAFTLEDVEVNGTYSQLKKYGYAFGINNVWGHKAIRVKADGNWGVYGNNNVSEATLRDCMINRFDIHSYGRDVTFKRCEFFRLYNAFGGTFGKVEYDRCLFNDVRPSLDGGSYNSFVALDVVFNRCTIQLKKNVPWLIEYQRVPTELNERAELRERYLPNVTVRNSTIHLLGGEKKWFVYKAPKASDLEAFKGGQVLIERTTVDDGTPEMGRIYTR